MLWYLDDRVIDDSSQTLSRTSTLNANANASAAAPYSTAVENELVIRQLTRSYFNAVLTCQAVNKHYSAVPVSTSLRIDMNRE